MGAYINPKGMTKVELFEAACITGLAHGPFNSPKDVEKAVRALPTVQERGFQYVCVIDNGAFVAAGIAYNEQEFRAFLPSEDDTRDRIWYWMATELLMDPDVSDLAQYYTPA